MTAIRTSEARALIESVAASAAESAPAEDAGLALVAHEPGVGPRYRAWRGRSGKRYLVTVMPLEQATRLEAGIVLLVAVEPDGSRQIVWGGETGTPFPALVLAPGVQLEVHVHLLAASAEGRAAVVADLADATQAYSSVLTVRAAASQDRVGSATPSRSSSRAVFTT